MDMVPLEVIVPIRALLVSYLSVELTEKLDLEGLSDQEDPESSQRYVADAVRVADVEVPNDVPWNVKVLGRVVPSDVGSDTAESHWFQ
jgi:hypothetical protein